MAKAFVAANGLTVRRGPFAGMKYSLDSVAATTLVPKLLGSFELELHPALDQIIDESGSSRTILNIGSAEGYYAVGLALRLPRAHVHAFDSDPALRALCARMATLNGVVNRISIHDAVDPFGLQALAHDLDSVFVLCDCEGCELGLLDPAKAASLRKATILVELHDFINPGVELALLGRFRSTHEIQVISTRARDPRNYAELEDLAHEDAALAVSEFRPRPMKWAWMQPLSGS